MTRQTISNLFNLSESSVKKGIKLCNDTEFSRKINFSKQEVSIILSNLNIYSKANSIILEEYIEETPQESKHKKIKKYLSTEEKSVYDAILNGEKIKCCAYCIFSATNFHPSTSAPRAYCQVFEKLMSTMKINPYKDCCKRFIESDKPKIWSRQLSVINPK